MQRSEEQALIERAVAGDREAAGALVRAHQESLYAYLLRLSGRPDVAEDIAQEAFVRVLLHLDRFDPRFRFSTWLFTIAKRLYVNANQKLRPYYDSEAVGRVSQSMGGKRPGDSGAFGAIRDEEVATNTRDTLQSVLDELGDEQREVVVLFHQQSWPISLIAQHMSIPEGTVKSHLHRARRKMRRLLEENIRSQAAVEEAWK